MPDLPPGPILDDKFQACGNHTPWLTTAPVQLKCSHNFCFCNRGSTRMRPSPEQHSTGTNSRYQTIYYRLLEAPASDLLLLSLEICG